MDGTTAIGAFGDLGHLMAERKSGRRIPSHPAYHRLLSHRYTWLWLWRDGSNLVLTTAISALDRMKEMPGFRYSHCSAIHYRGIEKADSDMFAEILQRIREGRWEVVGGWPVEPDCNITESFGRLTNDIVLKNYDVWRYL